MGIESYHSPPGLQPECWTLHGLQWESGSPLDSGGNTRERVKYSNGSTLEYNSSIFIKLQGRTKTFVLLPF